MRFFFIVVGVALCVAVSAIGYAIYQVATEDSSRNRYNRACENAGGYPYRARDAHRICIRRDALIEMPE